MKWIRSAGALVEAFRGDQFRPTIVLLSSPLLVTAWKSYGTPEYYLASVAEQVGLPATGMAAGIYCFVSCFVLLGLIPAAIVKFVFRERLADYGVRLGIRNRTFRSMAMCAPFFLLGGWIASLDPAVQRCYPVNSAAGTSNAHFAVHAMSYLLFYLGWEFHFRGFVQHGLRDKLGDTNAVLVQGAISCLAHLGKPPSETLSSLLGGLWWGVVAVRTQSLLSGLVQHFLLGLALDYSLCYGWN